MGKFTPGSLLELKQHLTLCTCMQRLATPLLRDVPSAMHGPSLTGDSCVFISCQGCVWEKVVWNLLAYKGDYQKV